MEIRTIAIDKLDTLQDLECLKVNISIMLEHFRNLLSDFSTNIRKECFIKDYTTNLYLKTVLQLLKKSLCLHILLS